MYNIFFASFKYNFFSFSLSLGGKKETYRFNYCGGYLRLRVVVTSPLVGMFGGFTRTSKAALLWLLLGELLAMLGLMLVKWLLLLSLARVLPTTAW